MSTIIRQSGLTLLLAGAVSTFAEIPVNHFIDDPIVQELSVSGDGKYILGKSFDSFQFLAFDTLQATSPPVGPNQGNKESILDYWWVNDERIMYSINQIVDPIDYYWVPGNFYTVNADGKRMSNPFNRGRDNFEINLRFVDTFDSDRRQVLMQSKQFRNFTEVQQSTPSVVRMSAYSKMNSKLTNRQRGPKSYGDLYVDRNGVVRLSYGGPGPVPELHYRADEDSEWQNITVASKIASAGARFEFLGFLPNNKSFYVIGNHDNPIAGLHLFTPDENSYEEVYQHDIFDVAYARWNHGKTAISTVVVNDPYSTVVPLLRNDTSVQVLASLAKTFEPDRVEVVSAARDGNRFLIHVGTGAHPGEFYALKLAEKDLRLVTKVYPLLTKTQLANVQPFVRETSDGVQLYGYFTRPKEVGDNGAPMIVLIHEGPHLVRDSVDFNPVVQLLANRGYSVLQVNYRGSGGQGREFEALGFHEWGGRIVDDIVEVTQWAANLSVVDGDHICAMGENFGAFVAMAAAVKEPDLFDCVVGHQGIYDLAKLREGDRRIPVSPPILQIILGNNQPMLESQSPTNHADKLKAAVLLTHGGKDAWGPILQHDTMVRALKDAKVTHEILDESGKEHSFVAPEDRQRLYTKILEFLGKHI